jgi:hypothetical protein
LYLLHFVHSVSLVEKRLKREPGRDLGSILAAREDINERGKELQSEIPTSVLRRYRRREDTKSYGNGMSSTFRLRYSKQHFPWLEAFEVSSPLQIRPRRALKRSHFLKMHMEIPRLRIDPRNSRSGPRGPPFRLLARSATLGCGTPRHVRVYTGISKHPK